MEPGATQAAALDIQKAFDRVLIAGLIEYFVGFLLTFLFYSNRWVWKVLDGKSC